MLGLQQFRARRLAPTCRPRQDHRAGRNGPNMAWQHWGPRLAALWRTWKRCGLISSSSARSSDESRQAAAPLGQWSVSRNPDWCTVTHPARFVLRNECRSRFIKRDPKSGATDFAVFHNLIRDRAGNVYRDGKSHAWIGIARAEEGRIMPTSSPRRLTRAPPEFPG